MSHARWRRWAFASATAPVAMLLSGCLSITTTVVVSSDATASGEFSLEVARQSAALLGISSAETLNDSLRESGQADFTSPTDCTASEDEAFLRLTCPFQDQSFTDPTDLLLIRRDGDQMVVTVRNSGQSEDMMDMPIGTLSVQVQTPGPIRSITGQYATQTGDSSARVTASLTDNVDVTITSDATGSASLPWIPIILGVAAVLAGSTVAILIVVLSRRRRRANSTAPAAPTGKEPFEPPSPGSIPGPPPA